MKSHILLVLGILAVLLVSGCISGNTSSYSSNYKPESTPTQIGESSSNPSEIIGPESREKLTEFNMPGDADNQYRIKFIEYKAYKDEKNLIHIVGKVLHNGTQNISMVGIDATFYDKNGYLLEIGPASAATTIVEDWDSGEIKDFEIELPGLQSARAVRYYLKFDGDMLVLKK